MGYFRPRLGYDYGTPVARGAWQLVDEQPSLPVTFGDPTSPFTDPATYPDSNGHLVDVRGIGALELLCANDSTSLMQVRIGGFSPVDGVYLPSGIDLQIDVSFSSAGTNAQIGSRVAALNPNLNASWYWSSDWTPAITPGPSFLSIEQPASNVPTFVRLFVDRFDFIAFGDRASANGVAPFFIRPVQGLWSTPGSEWWRN